MSVSDKLSYLLTTKELIKDAIVDKGVSVSESDTFRSYATKIGQISGSAEEKKEVAFYDYDGTYLWSYTREEIAAMDSLPGVPDSRHANDEVPIIFDDWNWTKDQILSVDFPIDVGAFYNTADGKTHIITGFVTPANRTISFSIIPTSDFTIDWGDGNISTKDDMGTAYFTNTYVIHYDYEKYGHNHIKVTGTNKLDVSGSGNADSSADLLERVYLGSEIINFSRISGAGAWERAAGLKTWTHRKSLSGDSDYLFVKAPKLEYIVANSIGGYALGQQDAASMYSLKGLSIGKNSYNYGFGSNDCVVLKDIRPVWSANNITGRATFAGFDRFPARFNKTAMNEAFCYNNKIKDLVIPNGVKSVSNLKCMRSLETVTFPEGFETISDSCFADSNINLRRYIFKGSTPPTLVGTNSLYKIKDPAISSKEVYQVIVPPGKLSLYKNTTNYGSYNIVEDFVPTTIKSFTIEADDVECYETTTAIRWSIVADGTSLDGKTVYTDVAMAGSEVSDSFPMNMDPDNEVQIEISLVKYGQRRTTTITQGSYHEYGYSVSCSGWVEGSANTTGAKNPDSTKYDMYSSKSSNTMATNYIKVDITGFSSFPLWISSNSYGTTFMQIGRVPTTSDYYAKHKSSKFSGLNLIGDYLKVVITDLDPSVTTSIYVAKNNVSTDYYSMSECLLDKSLKGIE